MIYAPLLQRVLIAITASGTCWLLILWAMRS